MTVKELHTELTAILKDHPDDADMEVIAWVSHCYGEYDGATITKIVNDHISLDIEVEI